ncbi:MAG: bifunctional demethylmenaquinone methyltransferase/2-methoxy-6-polyprenyl-1,4-benzoquinol methylase UbiE [Bacteroidales bacterium]
MDKNKEVIKDMFNSIAPTYDSLNHLLSFNVDKRWRKKLIISLNEKKLKVLDLACGTGDLSEALYDKGYDVIGADYSEKMLEIAKNRANQTHKNIKYIRSNAEHLSFEDEVFDVVTISFGIRNFDKREVCLSEIFRVLKKNGKLRILEFSIPKNKFWKFIYSWYFKKILPFIGRIVSKQKSAYNYLPNSTFDFPNQKDFVEELNGAGFQVIKYWTFTGGICTLYSADKY